VLSDIYNESQWGPMLFCTLLTFNVKTKKGSLIFLTLLLTPGRGMLHTKLVVVVSTFSSALLIPAE